MNDNIQITETNKETGAIAGFWRRLLAFMVDVLIIGVVGFVLGLGFFDLFVELGGWGRIIGFVIALLYFGLMNSTVSNGQTIGKRLAKIRVAGATGEPLGIGRSCLRFTVLGIPFFLNGAPIPQEVLTSWAAIIISVVIFGLGLSIVYLFLFNRRTRQSLHDVIVGSYVLHANGRTVDMKAGTWKGHNIVVSALLVLAALVPAVMGNLAQREPFKELLALQRAIQAEPGVGYASVNVGKTVFAGTQKGTTTTNYIACRIVLTRKTDDYDSLADKLAKILLERYPTATQKDTIALTISYGYDIGIASAWQNRNYSFSPDQWKERVRLQSNKRPDPT